MSMIRDKIAAIEYEKCLFGFGRIRIREKSGKNGFASGIREKDFAEGTPLLRKNADCGFAWHYNFSDYCSVA